MWNPLDCFVAEATVKVAKAKVRVTAAGGIFRSLTDKIRANGSEAR